MRHRPTKDLYAYWRELLPQPEPATADAPRWPDRSRIEPSAMRRWLGDVFILHAVGGEVRYRLAGTRLCALHGDELAGTPFLSAFDGDDRSAARSWIGTFGSEAVPLLITCRAFNPHGASVALETLLLPLANTQGAGDHRALGITTPETAVSWAGILPVVRQEITSVRVLRPWESNLARADWPLVRPVRGDEMRPVPDRRRLTGADGQALGRRVAHLTVLDGGFA